MPIAKTYALRPGDTLATVAHRHKLSLDELLAANQQVATTQPLVVGQPLNIPTPATEKAAVAAVADNLAAVGRYDGVHPAPGTISTQRAALISPPLTNTANNRSDDTYEQIISQFAVGYNPRYLPGGGYTYCNIFVWDVTRALGCPIPHWITATGAIAAPAAPGAYEININAGVTWMQQYGVATYGWQPATTAEAQQHANQGGVAVALWQNPTGGHGHTAMVRPGTLTARGPAIAQAGSTNFNDGHLADGFGRLKPLFYLHP